MFLFSKSPIVDVQTEATKAYLAFPPGFTHTPLETLQILQQEAHNALRMDHDASESISKEEQNRQAHAHILGAEMQARLTRFEEQVRAEALEGEKNWVRGGGILRDESTGRVNVQRTMEVRRVVEREDRERAIRGRWEAYERKWLELLAASVGPGASMGPSKPTVSSASASPSPPPPSACRNQHGPNESSHSGGACTGSTLDTNASSPTSTTAKRFGRFVGTKRNSTSHTQTASPMPTLASDAITFAIMPWPLIEPPKSAEDLRDPVRIGEFLFESLGLESHKSITRRDRVRASLKRWHPDKLGGLLARVRDDEMDAVKEGIDAVVMSLMKLQDSVKGVGKSS